MARFAGSQSHPTVSVPNRPITGRSDYGRFWILALAAWGTASRPERPKLRRHHRLVHEGGARLALDRDGKAAFFTRKGAVLGGSPPLPEVIRILPEPPAPPPDRLSNGAPRFVDSAVPLPLELAALEAGA
ncbi:MAG: hypothetical protein OXU69_01710 [Gemmatimonadota bacterium]|nr:hypothetical protein [Gemmatimonadota bacterium]MDE2983393.1 hypothetical protein [Gemmatimonadota bacterium]